MKITRYSVSACCGQKSLMFTTDCPIAKQHITELSKHGFYEEAHFTKAGIFYVYNADFIITGPIGSNKLQIKQKGREDMSKKLNDLEVLLGKL